MMLDQVPSELSATDAKSGVRNFTLATIHRGPSDQRVFFKDYILQTFSFSELIC